MQIEEYISTVPLDNNGYVQLYYHRMLKFNEIHDILELNTQDDVIVDGEGDLCSPLVIYLPSKEQDDILPIYKALIEKHNFKINDIYVSYFVKCSNNELNAVAFKEEINTIGTYAFYIFHNMTYDLAANCSVTVDYNDIKQLQTRYNETKDESILQELFNKVEPAIKFFLSRYSKS